MQLLYHLDEYVLLAAWIAAIPVGVYAFIHAARTRPDAFTAAEKLTKPAWLAITGGGLAVLLIFTGGPLTLIWVVGLIAVLVYLVDVRPRLIEVQRRRR
jgi:hypothetical protein